MYQNSALPRPFGHILNRIPSVSHAHPDNMVGAPPVARFSGCSAWRFLLIGSAPAMLASNHSFSMQAPLPAGPWHSLLPLTQITPWLASSPSHLHQVSDLPTVTSITSHIHFSLAFILLSFSSLIHHLKSSYTYLFPTGLWSPPLYPLREQASCLPFITASSVPETLSVSTNILLNK